MAALVLLAFAARLVDLQGFRGDQLAAAAVDQRTVTVQVLADRGQITDTNGVPLAQTLEARHITADQTLIEDPRAAAEALAPSLAADPDVLAERLTGDRRFVYVAKEQTPQAWRQIQELGIVGIFSERTTKRVYPAGNVAANVVGFVGAEGDGMAGVEYARQDILAGVDGWRTYERAAGGAAIPTAEMSAQEPVPGTDIQLTIDRDIQYVAQRVLSEAVERFGAESGSVVVMDPRTGHVLALATAPTFDANAPEEAAPEDLGNRALTDAFEPGSTAKVMTMAAVLEEDGARRDTVFQIPPVLERAGKVFHDASDHGGYSWDLETILSRSSNIGTILAAETIPQETFYEYLQRFGIGEATGLGFPGETSGYLPPREEWSGTTFPTLTFGQGFSVNAVQAASVFATIANDGVRVPASLVKNSDVGDAPIDGERVVSGDTARTIREMLENVVADGGTAPMAGIPGYRVGGKTGTAQVINLDCGCYDGSTIGSFLGMAPIEQPELVVGVTIVKPASEQRGGEVAGPVFREVMTYALQARKVAPITPSPDSAATSQRGTNADDARRGR
ncbi:MAG: peptidoglycan D,D-transpeptidase FtsI family protein [bacterium]